MMDNRRLRVSLIAAALAALLPLARPSVCSGAAARTASMSIGIHVERHAGVFLPADETALVPASNRETAAQSPAAVGNGEAQVVLFRERGSLSPVSSRRTRVAMIVFEP